MDQPEYILKNGTKIVTTTVDDSTSGMMISPKFLQNRRTDMIGTIWGIVPGHGGDVYWVKHDNGEECAYGWWEFELANPDRMKAILKKHNLDEK